MSGWSLVYEGFDPAQERLRETLCTLGNGYFATRGAAAESAGDEVHYPGTYLAGCYNRLPSVIDGTTLEHEDLVNAPNWLPLTFRCPGDPWFDLASVTVLAYRQELDLRRGVLVRDMRVRDAARRTTRVQSERLVHMATPHLAALRTTITPEDWSGPLEIRAALDGRVVNDLVARYRHLAKRHLEPVETEAVGDDGIALTARTRQSQIVIAQAARVRVAGGDRGAGGVRAVVEEAGYIAHDTVVHVEAGTPFRIEKVVSLYTSRDRAISESGLEARTAIAGPARSTSCSRHMPSPGSTSGDLRHGAGSLTPNRSRGQRRSRDRCARAAAHLPPAADASPHTRDLDAGVPARGLHGEATGATCSGTSCSSSRS